jgi:hypothetical protein
MEEKCNHGIWQKPEVGRQNQLKQQTNDTMKVGTQSETVR